MDIYVVGIVVISIAILLAMMTHGFHKGFADEIKGLVTLVASIFVILLIAGIVEGLRGGSASNLTIGLVLLVLFGAIYRFIRIFVTSLHVIAHLPIISWLDSALGLVTGLIEGFAILYVMEYFLRNFLLA